MVICCRAARRRPLRSNRVMISPVRLRAKASGLTRMSVRSTTVVLLEMGCGSGGRRLLGGSLRAGRLARAPTLAPRGGCCHADLRLTEGTDLPCGIKRASARLARILELAHAVWAAQEIPLHLEVTVGTEVVAELGQPR